NPVADRNYRLARAHFRSKPTRTETPFPPRTAALAHARPLAGALASITVAPPPSVKREGRLSAAHVKQLPDRRPPCTESLAATATSSHRPCPSSARRRGDTPRPLLAHARPVLADCCMKRTPVLAARCMKRDPLPVARVKLRHGRCSPLYEGGCPQAPVLAGASFSCLTPWEASCSPKELPLLASKKVPLLALSCSTARAWITAGGGRLLAHATAARRRGTGCLLMVVSSARHIHTSITQGSCHAAGYGDPCTRLEVGMPMHGSAWLRKGDSIGWPSGILVINREVSVCPRHP
ncbi:hypothetical protein Dimus_037125, partial [Dionaea muscipula]